MPIEIGDPVSRAGLNPNESALYFKSAGLRDDAFIVRKIEGEEAISRPFWFRIDLTSRDADIDAADLLGKRATLFLHDRAVHGIVSEFEYLGFTADEHEYRAMLRPQLWTRSLRRDSEVFLDVEARDLIKAALGDLDHAINSSESFPQKEYVAQYNETDLDFLSRIAEHWGIGYYIDQDPDGADSVAFFTDSTSLPPAADEALPFDPEVTLRARKAAASFFAERQALVPGRVLVKDFNYRDPETALLSENERRADDFDSLHYEYGTHHGDQSEGDYLAKVRSEAIECRRRVFAGKSNWPEIEAGYIFELERHPRAAFNGKYLITHVRHTGSQASQAMSEGDAGGLDYANEFTCIPADVPYRPPRDTPVPTIPGVMTAKIESAGGDYAHIDSDGRYNARMHFDLGERGEAQASAPIRMNQPYSGPGYGMHFPNHANTEIVWACLNGDPDRPIAIGTAPNPSNSSPVTSENRAQNVIRTMGQNEITMDDTRGSEMFFIHATKDNTIDVVNDQEFTIGANRKITVGGSHVETIGGSMTQDVGGSSSETVAATKTVTVGTAMSLTVGSVMSVTVGGAKTEQIGGVSSETVGGAKSLAVGGAYSLALGSSLTESVGGAVTRQVGGPVKEKVGGKYQVEAAADYVVSAKTIQLTAQNEIVLKAGGAQIILKKSGDILIKGKKIEVKASGNVIMKGSQIKQN